MTMPVPHDAIVPVAILGSAFVSMIVYAITGADRDPSHEEKGTHLFLGVGDFLVHWFIWIIDPFVAFSVRFGLTPDHHSYIATVFGVVSAGAMATGHLALGGWMLAVNGFIDTLDGHLATDQPVVESWRLHRRHARPIHRRGHVSRPSRLSPTFHVGAAHRGVRHGRL